MLSRTALTTLRRHAARSFSTEPVTMVNLHFNVPHETIYKGAEVYSVILPGSEGEYGVTANHVPYVAQLKPGVLQILHTDASSEPEKYFIAGGYALTHPDSKTEVVTPEAVKVEDLDPSAVSSQYEAAKTAYGAAAAGSVEQAEAQIAMEVNKAMGAAVGLSLG